MKLVAILVLLAASGARAQTLQPFAPGRISMPDSGESFGSLSPDGKEFYYTIHRADFSRHRIVVSHLDGGGQWTKATTLPFSGTYTDREPKLSPDGKRLYFSSTRPIAAGDTARPRDLDLWMAERGASGDWGAPRHIDAPVNTTAQEFCPVVTANGTIYFIAQRAGAIGTPKNNHNVWRARATDKSGLHFATPENLGPAINTGVETNVFVTPDERLMLVSRDSAPEGLGGDDIFVATSAGGVWQPMRHLDRPINSEKYDYGPSVSPDGKWLFFTSWRNGDSNIYRIEIGAIERDGVRRAVLDYLEGFYEGDTVKLARSLRPELFKYGFWKEKDSASYAGEKMTYDEAIGYARKFKAGKRTTPATAPREITIFDVQDQTASAKVTAWWGTDYVLLAKYDGRWMIAHVMWQGP